MASTIQNALNRHKTRCLTEKTSPEDLTEPSVLLLLSLKGITETFLN
jgi:hypothetical protein